MENKPDPAPSHLLIFPFPAQGHINSMLMLAELLAFSGLNVTFLNSEYNHERLVRYTDIEPVFLSNLDSTSALYPMVSLMTTHDQVTESWRCFNLSSRCPSQSLKIWWLEFIQESIVIQEMVTWALLLTLLVNFTYSYN